MADSVMQLPAGAARPPRLCPRTEPAAELGIDLEHAGDDRALLKTFYAACLAEGGTADEITLRGLNAVLARWGRPAPPVEGEVGELAEWLKANSSGVYFLAARAANLLLQQQARIAELEAERMRSKPVPVSERLPGAEDCESHGWCWVLYRGYSTWALEPPYGPDGMPTGWSHWLPAHAMPIPQEEAQQ